MPVDDEINLDNPEGISKEDIDRMVEQADELERIAYTSEKNAETVKKNLKVFENKSFKEINAMTGEAKNLNIGDDTDIREKIAEILRGSIRIRIFIGGWIRIFAPSKISLFE